MDFREVWLPVHPAVLDRLAWEAALIPGVRPEEVLSIRLCRGMGDLEDGLTQSFWWHTPSATVEVSLPVPLSLPGLLEQWASYMRMGVEALVHAFATAEACEPPEIREARTRLGLHPELHPEIPLRGRDQSEHADLGLYRSGFFSLLQRDVAASPSKLAAICLARDVLAAGQCNGVPVSEAAMELARRVIGEAEA